MKFLRSFELATAAACLIMMMAGAISAGHLEQRLRGSRVARLLNATPESAPPSPKLRGLRSVSAVTSDLMDDIVEIAPADNLSSLLDLNRRTHDVWVAYKKDEITADQARAKMGCIKKDYHKLVASGLSEHSDKVESSFADLMIKINELEAVTVDHPKGILAHPEISMPEINLPEVHRPTPPQTQCGNAVPECDAYVKKARHIVSWYDHGVVSKEEAYNVLVALRGSLVSHVSPCMHDRKVQAAVNRALAECFRLQSKLEYVVEHVPTVEEIVAIIDVQAHEIWEAFSAAKMTLVEAVAATRTLRRELVEKTYALGAKVDTVVQNALTKLIKLEVRLVQAAQSAVNLVDSAVDSAVSHAHVVAGNAVDKVDSAVNSTIDIAHATGEAAVGAVDNTIAHLKIVKDGLLHSLNEAIDFVETAKEVTVEQVNQHIAASKEVLIGAVELTHEQMQKIDAHLAHLVDHIAFGAHQTLAKKELLLQFLVNLRVKIHALPSKFITLHQLKIFTKEVHMSLASDLAVMACYKRRALEKHMDELKAKCAAIAPALSEHEWCKEEVKTCQQQLNEVPPCEVSAVPLPTLEQHGEKTKGLLNQLHSSWFGKVNHVEQLVSELHRRGTPDEAIEAILEALLVAAK